MHSQHEQSKLEIDQVRGQVEVLLDIPLEAVEYSDEDLENPEEGICIERQSWETLVVV